MTMVYAAVGGSTLNATSFDDQSARHTMNIEGDLSCKGLNVLGDILLLRLQPMLPA